MELDDPSGMNAITEVPPKWRRRTVNVATPSFAHGLWGPAKGGDDKNTHLSPERASGVSREYFTELSVPVVRTTGYHACVVLKSSWAWVSAGARCATQAGFCLLSPVVQKERRKDKRAAPTANRTTRK